MNTFTTRKDIEFACESLSTLCSKDTTNPMVDQAYNLIADARELYGLEEVDEPDDQVQAQGEDMSEEIRNGIARLAEKLNNGIYINNHQLTGMILKMVPNAICIVVSGKDTRIVLRKDADGPLREFMRFLKYTEKTSENNAVEYRAKGVQSSTFDLHDCSTVQEALNRLVVLKVPVFTDVCVADYEHTR